MERKHLATLDLVAESKRENQGRRQLGLKLGPSEWSVLNELAASYGYSRHGMARRLLCEGIRALGHEKGATATARPSLT